MIVRAITSAWIQRAETFNLNHTTSWITFWNLWTKVI